MNKDAIRTWAIRWLYAVFAAHLILGLLLPWFANAALFDAYHRAIGTAFWGQAAPADVLATSKAQQVWWISLFGPTVQYLAICMAGLTSIGALYRNSAVWAWLLGGLILWAPQDMFISLRMACWPNVWIDCLALASLLPPLFWLWRNDRVPCEMHTMFLKETTR